MYPRWGHDASLPLLWQWTKISGLLEDKLIPEIIDQKSNKEIKKKKTGRKERGDFPPLKGLKRKKSPYKIEIALECISIIIKAKKSAPTETKKKERKSVKEIKTKSL